MKKIASLTFIIALTFFMCTVVTGQKRELYPQVFFDSTIAKTMLGYGKSSIEGVAFTRMKNGYGMRILKKVLATNTVITLYPVTPYFEAWYSLRKKEEGRKTSVLMSSDAYRWRITVKSDNYGRFKFPEMKPGKYFLQAWVDYSVSGSYSQYSGRGYNAYGGTTDYYEYKTYTKNIADRIGEFVTIERDGQAIEMKLK